MNDMDKFNSDMAAINGRVDQLIRENAELREALELFAHIDQTRDGYRPNERVREDFLRACPEFIGYAKSARALLSRVEGK